MRCELCLAPAPCTCGARPDEELHRRLFAIRFLLSQMNLWRMDGVELPASLRSSYLNQRNQIVAQLKPEAPLIVAEVVEEKPIPKILKIEREPEPPPKQFHWRDLFTERNIRWILNLGIFIFSVALAVFIHSQWTGMTPFLRSFILFSATGLAFGAGHLLRRTLLSETGKALISLALIAVPIDVFGAVQFGLLPSTPAVGMIAAAVSLAIYLAHRLTWLSSIAAMALVAFGLATAGVPWLQIPAWTAPFALAMTRVAKIQGIAFTYLLALSSFAAGWIPLEVALASGAALVFFDRRLMWGTAAAVGAMFAVVMVEFRPPHAAELCAAFGALLVVTRRWEFGTVGGLSSLIAMGVAMAARDWTALGIVFALNGAACWILKFRDAAYFLGLLAVGSAFELKPIPIAIYALAISRSRVAIGAAGVAMFLVSVDCLRYYDVDRWQGALISAACAAAFAIGARREKSRLVADLAYGSAGFAFVYLLRLAELPTPWLAPAMALFAIALYVLKLRPTIFTGAAASLGCLALAFVQWLVAAKHGPAAATFGIVSLFCFAISGAHRQVAHAGVYLAVAMALCIGDWIGLQYQGQVACVLAIACAALIVSRGKPHQHLGLAGATVLIAALAATFLNPQSYEFSRLLGTAMVAALAAAVAVFLERIHVPAASALAGIFASAAWLLFLSWLSTGSRFGGLAVLLMTVALAVAAAFLDRRRAIPLLCVAAAVAAVAMVVALPHAEICVLVAAITVAIYLLRGWSWVAVAFGIAGILRALVEWNPLWMIPVAFVFLAISRVRRPAVVLSIFAVLAGTVAGERVWLLLADTAIFALVAFLYHRPKLVYLAAVSFMAFHIAAMDEFGLRPSVVAVVLFGIALAQVVFARRDHPYSKPIFATGLVAAIAVILFGIGNGRAYVGRDIDWAIWGLMLGALGYGVAARIQRIPWMIAVAAAHLLGAYYLSLEKYDLRILELYTVPIAAGIAAWSVALPRGESRRWVEALAVAATFAPSAIASFVEPCHTLAALGGAVALVLGGMVVRRRVPILLGTLAFGLEVLGKVLEFLIRAEVPLAQWGMFVGGFLIVLAALFESRKLRFVRERAELYLARWD